MSSIRRSSPSPARPVASIARSALRAASTSVDRTRSAACACSTMTARLCATRSCSSRAIRARSCATAARLASSRSRSSASAREARPAISSRRCCIQRPSPHTAPSTNQAGKHLVDGVTLLEPGDIDTEHECGHDEEADARGPCGAVGAQRVDAQHRGEPRLSQLTAEQVVGRGRGEQHQQRREWVPTCRQHGQGEGHGQRGVERPAAHVVRRRPGPDLHLGGHEQPCNRQDQRRPGHQWPRHAPQCSESAPARGSAFRQTPVGRRREGEPFLALTT